MHTVIAYNVMRILHITHIICIRIFSLYIDVAKFANFNASVFMWDNGFGHWNYYPCDCDTVDRLGKYNFLDGQKQNVDFTVD